LSARLVNAASLVFHPDAANEYADAARWYGERSATVHDSFVAEIERVLRLIVAFPDRWPRYGPRHRRMLVRRFPFSVVYLETGDRLWVVAVAHAKRKPLYWVKRTIP
jgi:plasmid stabilization system protein ParE